MLRVKLHVSAEDNAYIQADVLLRGSLNSRKLCRSNRNLSAGLVLIVAEKVVRSSMHSACLHVIQIIQTQKSLEILSVRNRGLASEANVDLYLKLHHLYGKGNSVKIP
jgi:hypothetical protein